MPTEHVDVGLPTKIPAVPPDPENPPQASDDGYPAVIADARNAYKVETVGELEDFWLTHLDRRNLDARFLGGEAVPYINRARWLVDCPECNAGNFVWDRCMWSCCLDCGLFVKVTWQSPFVRSQAIRLLAVRPIVNCNWNAHLGETIEELERENRWQLGPDQASVEKNGLIVPRGLDVPEALAKYVDPEVA